jgi:ribosomal protein L11 methyltransferase
VRAFVVTVSAAEADVAADALWQLGVRAIEERTHRGDDGPNGQVELWTAVGEDPGAAERAVAALAGRWSHRLVDVDDEPAHTWREFAEPMWVTDDVVVVPAWQRDSFVVDHPASAPASAPACVVAIEPGGAFGLGDHPTTMLSLRAVLALLDGPLDVLDVGCGTGVIAVMAAMRQPRRVRAVDVASAAVEATIDNARRNGVESNIDADTTGAGHLEGDYDLVVANILAPVLVELADDLRRLTRPDGRLVISGVLAGAHQHVLDALSPMQVERTDELEGWVAVSLRHPA